MTFAILLNLLDAPLHASGDVFDVLFWGSFVYPA